MTATTRVRVERICRAGRGIEPGDAVARLSADAACAYELTAALSKGALGELLTTQKRFAEAEVLLLESYESLKSSQSADSPRIRTAAGRLFTLYTDWGKPGDANNFRSQS